MRLPIPLTIICMLMTVAAPALGASHKDHEDCDADNDPTRNIAGCSRIISDAHESTKIRSIAYVGRGLAVLDKGDRDSAIADFSEALRLDPKNVLALNNRAIAFNAKGDHDRAIADLTAAIAINPLPRSDIGGRGFVNLYSNRGVSWQAKGDLDHAIADFDQALTLAPHDAEAFNRRGIAWQAKGQHDRAVADFSLAIAAAPRFASAYFNRALVRNSESVPDLAVADFSEAIRLAPNVPQAYYARAETYMVLHDPDHAIADVDQAIRLSGATPPSFMYVLRGSAWYERYMHTSAVVDPKDLERAIADFNEAIRLGPYNKDAYRARAAAESANGESERAAADLSIGEGRAPILLRPLDVLK